MRTTQLLLSLLLPLSLLSLAGHAQAQDEPKANEGASENGADAPEESPLAAADESAEDTGLSFRVDYRLTYKAEAGSKAGDTAKPPAHEKAACTSVSVGLKRGNLSARNQSTDLLLSFSDLPPGTYHYDIMCSASGHGSGKAEGTAEVVDGKMTLLPITIEIATRIYEGAIELSSGAAGISFGSSGGSPDQKGGDLDSKPRALTILADLGYITSKGTHQGIAPLAFTDLGVWSLAAAFTPERRLTFGGKVAGLAKSPALLDARVLQSAGGNVSYAFGHHFAASAGGQWQAGLDTTRSVLSSGGGVIWRKLHAEFVKTEFSLGGEAVMHRGTQGDGNRTSTFATGTAEVQLCWNRCSRRFGATWFGFDAAIPISHSDKGSALVGAKPNSALGFHVGSFMRVNETFDIFANVKWHDRGDREVVQTEFGTLLGGFDQIQMNLGAIFYFQFGKKVEEDSDMDSDYVRAL